MEEVTEETEVVPSCSIVLVRDASICSAGLPGVSFQSSFCVRAQARMKEKVLKGLIETRARHEDTPNKLGDRFEDG